MKRMSPLSLLIVGLLIGGTACAAESPLALSPASGKVLPSQTIDFHALIGAAAEDITLGSSGKTAAGVPPAQPTQRQNIKAEQRSSRAARRKPGRPG